MAQAKYLSSVTPTFKRYKHWNSIEQQYWQRSKIPTMHFQWSLPRLPIPKLEDTCDRYLAAQQPILSDESFTKIKAHVTEFNSTIGKKLQERLILQDQSNKHTSYISKPWFDMYLRDRKPLPINYNPILVFKNDEKTEYNTQLIKTTNMLISSLRFYNSLLHNVLEPEVYHMNPKKSDTKTFRNVCSKVPTLFSWYAAYIMFNAYPLDMSQYHNLFGSTRIPQMDQDLIYRNEQSRHVLVQHKGNFYTFDVLDENGFIYPAENIMGCLKSILENAVLPSEFPLGILTTLKRDEWHLLRDRLAALGNEKALSSIDSALFNICLDDCVVGEDPISLCRNYLHGDGKNRWFDKSFSLIVTSDGVAGINFEHSWGDGVAILRYFQDIHKDSLSNPTVNPNTKPVGEENIVQKLEINLDDKVKNAITSSVKEYKSICDSLDFNVVQLEGLGKKLCKKHHISPDAIMQLGFQVAYHKMTGKCVASYESCSTAAFKHGRTETIRPCTMETKAYSMAINSKQPPSKTELQRLLFECSKKHGQLTKEAAMGQGFDRHLFALRLQADNNIPSIYQDPEFAELNHNILSTSTLSSPSVWAGGFGPVVKDGLGIGYSIADDDLGVLTTNYPSHSNGKDFMVALKKSYQELLGVLYVKSFMLSPNDAIHEKGSN